MTSLKLRPYRPTDSPAAGSVPVSIVVLTLNEEINITRCLGSVAWAEQVVVVDSGSTDATVKLAKSFGAEIVEQPWLGYSGQREFSLRLPLLRHDWVYWVDADQWISPQLAAEVSDRLRAPACAAFTQRLRLVFEGSWIRHCGWYRGSWNVNLLNRRHCKLDGSPFGERVCVDGPIHRLAHDIVDEDGKGLAAWLSKHVSYAELEARRRGNPLPLAKRLQQVRDRPKSKPLARAVAKDLIFPSVPVKPVALFTYMYLVRLGFLDGRAGLIFCFYQAWFQVSVNAFRAGSMALRKAVS
jgi:glycosyltransferase involved in cell wall biosynthesis